MEKKEFQGNTFYVDDITRELSRRYDVNSYKAYFGTIGSANPEAVLGRFMFIARLVGEVVGTDVETFRKKFPGEQWYDSVDMLVHTERNLEGYIAFAEEKLRKKLVRVKEHIENGQRKKIYFPKKELVELMLKGGEFIPFEKRWLVDK